MSSLLHRSISFSQLPQIRRDQDNDEDATTSISSGGASRTLPPSLSSSPGRSAAPPVAEANMDASTVSGMAEIDVAKGGYLGRFFPEDKGEYEISVAFTPSW